MRKTKSAALTLASWQTTLFVSKMKKWSVSKAFKYAVALQVNTYHPSTIRIGTMAIKKARLKRNIKEYINVCRLDRVAIF